MYTVGIFNVNNLLKVDFKIIERLNLIFHVPTTFYGTLLISKLLLQYSTADTKLISVN